MDEKGTNKIQKIGNVTLNDCSLNENNCYTDGEIEDTLLEIVKQNETSKLILAENYAWPILAHLSPERENIVSVMDITKEKSVLEIGAGCGAITGALARHAKLVDCVELSHKRSQINAFRNKNDKNVTIFVGNFEDINFNKHYDVITLIGVFEYSALYWKSKQPFDTFLKKIKSLLKPNGKLYIAIENKFGLKYFAGCCEDHTQRYFDSIEGYSDGNLVRTFSRTELKNLLFENGYSTVYFYYPFPDYKMPQMIYSEDYLPKVGELKPAAISYDTDRLIFFDEIQAFNCIIESGDFETFSNSFLVEASI